MARQTWTAVVAALCFVACALVATMAPVPFVVWTPGVTTDLLAAPEGEPIVEIANATDYPASGQLLLTRAQQTRPDGTVSLVEALHAYWTPDREVVPRYTVYAPGAGADEVDAEQAAQLSTAQQDAKAAALRTAGIRVDPVPVVLSVNPTGPATGKLLANDVVVAVRTGTAAPVPVQTAQDANQAVASGQVGDQVVFTVQRGPIRQDVPVTTVSSKSKADLPVAGVSFTQGYLYAPAITFALDAESGGAGGGLMMALAVYDKLTPDPLLGDRVVAGTGTIDANGTVGRVVAVREKLAAARQAGASVFLVPRANCADLGGAAAGVRLVAVGTLAEAVDALGALADPQREKSVRGCS